MRRLLAALLALAAFVPVAAAQDSPRGINCTAMLGELPKSWEGKAFAVDGGTLGGIGLRPQLRLWGIQAPELFNRLTGQESPDGMRVRAALEDLLAAGDRTASCKLIKWDRSCRALAQCTITAGIPLGTPPQPQDIALRLLEDGLVYGAELADTIPGDPTASERYAHYESLARKAGKGLWPAWLGTTVP